jgi:hypothetical protein
MLGVPLQDIFILSLGTTEDVTKLSSRLADGGLAQWLRPATSVLLRAQTRGSFHAAEHLVGPDHVVRVDAPAPANLFQLDRLDARRIRGLAEARPRHECPRVLPFTAQVAAPFTPVPVNKEATWPTATPTT